MTDAELNDILAYSEAANTDATKWLTSAEDYEFAANARTDLPAVVKELQEARRLLEEAASWLESRPDYTEGDAATSSAIRGFLGVSDAE
jgi:hypothetical protein